MATANHCSYLNTCFGGSDFFFLLVQYRSLFTVQDFFGQLDQRVLSVFLKACDELTDILPQEEQEGLQETVRRLHKHWKVRGRRALTLSLITVRLSGRIDATSLTIPGRPLELPPVCFQLTCD